MKYKKNLIIALLLFITELCLFATGFSFASSNKNWKDNVCEIIKEKSNTQNELMWLISPKDEYKANWLHYEADTLIYTQSNYYIKQKGVKNYSFLINPYNKKEISVEINGDIYYISLFSAPQKGCFDKYNLFSYNETFDLTKDFGISKALSDLLVSINFSYLIQNTQEVKIENSYVCEIKDSLISEMLGDLYIVLPTIHSLDVAQYTGHSYFVLKFGSDYLANYAYLQMPDFFRKINNANYNYYFSDSIEKAFYQSSNLEINNIIYDRTNSKEDSPAKIIHMVLFLIVCSFSLFTFKIEQKICIAISELAFYYFSSVILYISNTIPLLMSFRIMSYLLSLSLASVVISEFAFLFYKAILKNLFARNN